MKLWMSAVAAVGLLAVAACTPKTITSPEAVISEPGKSSLNLAEKFDCVRETGGILIAAHRGGPDSNYPENALETLQHGFAAGIGVFEIDIAETSDGVLTLMHDNRIDRTSTGSGYIADTDWAGLSHATLQDDSGNTTPYHAPKFTDILLWAKQSGAVLELDRKDTTSYRNIISAVHAAGAEQNVVLISYNDQQAEEIAKIDNSLMMTAGARGSRDIEKLESLGVDRTRLIAWTGISSPDAAAWQRNAREGVESAFGTLGRKGERLDDAYWADNDPGEYEQLIEDGLVMLATDTPYRLVKALAPEERTAERCGFRQALNLH